MKIHKGDKVKVMTGKDKGKVGTVLKVFKDKKSSKHKVLVEGVNRVKKHVKPGAVEKEGGIITVERPISVSNVMYFNDKLGRPVRVGYTIKKGKKYRVCKKSGEVLDVKSKK